MLETAHGKPVGGAWDNASQWRSLPDPPGGCPRGGAYVSIVRRHEIERTAKTHGAMRVAARLE